jgi:hypothetical protein
MSLTFSGPFWRALQKRIYSYFMIGSATAHTANYSSHILKKVFEDRVISHRLWPARPPDLNPCFFYLWGNLKNKKSIQIIPTLDWLKHNSYETFPSIGVSELSLVSPFKRLEVYLRAEGWYFGCLLWWWVVLNNLCTLSNGCLYL